MFIFHTSFPPLPFSSSRCSSDSLYYAVSYIDLDVSNAYYNTVLLYAVQSITRLSSERMQRFIYRPKVSRYVSERVCIWILYYTCYKLGFFYSSILSLRCLSRSRSEKKLVHRVRVSELACLPTWYCFLLLIRLQLKCEIFFFICRHCCCRRHRKLNVLYVAYNIISNQIWLAWPHWSWTVLKVERIYTWQALLGMECRHFYWCFLLLLSFVLLLLLLFGLFIYFVSFMSWMCRCLCLRLHYFRRNFIHKHTLYAHTPFYVYPWLVGELFQEPIYWKMNTRFNGNGFFNFHFIHLVFSAIMWHESCRFISTCFSIDNFIYI